MEPFNIGAEFKPDRAVFLYCPGRVYDTVKYPVFHNAIFTEAQTKRVVRLADFNTLLDAEPWPEVKVVFLWSVGQCGSALLTNLFSCFDGTVVISEPDDIFMISEHKNSLSKERYEKTLHNALKFDLIQAVKRYPDTACVVIKPRSMSFWYILKIPAHIADSVTHIFMYWDVIPVIKSFIATFGHHIIKLNSLLFRLLGFSNYTTCIMNPVWDAFEAIPDLRVIGEKMREIQEGSDSFFVKLGFGGVPYTHALYRHLISNGFLGENIFAVKYDLLMKDPMHTFRQIILRTKCKSLDLTDKYVEKRLLETCSRECSEPGHMGSGKAAPQEAEVLQKLQEIMDVSGQTGDLQEGLLLPSTVQ